MRYDLHSLYPTNDFSTIIPCNIFTPTGYDLDTKKTGRENEEIKYLLSIKLELWKFLIRIFVKCNQMPYSICISVWIDDFFFLFLHSLI